ncbi:hypothetical protein GQ53DRAFT_756106 [Thozetella sp. PMI_491]|nr:hypothetical protein GQ53DRAFT_756106 [Thozetella sp. PMI_491]
MKVKQRTVCETCRSRKIGCDGRTPSCTQCLLRGLFCPGYQSDWTFVPQLTKEPPKPRNSSHRAASRQRQPKKGRRGAESEGESASSSGEASTTPESGLPTPPDSAQQPWLDHRDSICPSPSMPLVHVIALVVRCYVPDPEVQLLFPELAVSQPRICGAWVEVLPQLIGSGRDDEALEAAVKCLGVAIMSGGPIRKAPISAGLEAYGLALRSLGQGLQKADGAMADNLAASVMCLLLAELILPTSLGSWIAHVQGFGTLMRTSRPELYAKGPPHKLFVGSRPALIILAFLSRKTSFLSEEQWKTVPFMYEKPSPVQRLLNHAVAIPGIFERIDSLAALSSDKALSTARECVATFESLLVDFDEWESDFRVETQFPSFWTKPKGPDGHPSIWFQSITTANALTHYWAVQIICRHNITELRAKFPELAEDATGAVEPQPHESNLELAIKICQSIDYLMQDDMRLFGPTSAILPLRAAYDILSAAGPDAKEQLLWCQRIIARILGKGFQFVTLFFDLFQLSS